MISTARNDVDVLQHPTQYFIDVLLTLDPPRLTGREWVHYTNNEDVPLPKVLFRLFPNAWRQGDTFVSAVAVNGRAAQPSFQLQDSAMWVPFDDPLQPGQTVDIRVDFSVTVPQDASANYGAFSYQEHVLALAHFYPIVPVYDDEGWNYELAPTYGDVLYSDVSLYQVRFTGPADLTLVSSGITLADARHNDGTRTWYLVSGPMRDFYIAASPIYVVSQRWAGETLVSSYYSAPVETGGQRVLQWATDALSVYSRRFGPYPYNELDVVATPTSAGGIEYPGVVAIASWLYDQNPGGFFELAVAHEVAHQWFYGLVGSDQIDDPWLDEALAQYCSFLYFGDIHGSIAGGVVLRAFRTQWKSLPDEEDMPIGLPVAAYTPKAYSAIVYGKGPLFFQALRERMGDEAFFRFLRRYVAENRYDIATPERLKAIAEEEAGQSLGNLFQDWVGR